MNEVVSTKLDRALLTRIDRLASNRNEFIRQAVEEKVQRSSRQRQSTWDLLQGIDGLDIAIRSASGKVKSVELDLRARY